jgi:hypothetical protein
MNKKFSSIPFVCKLAGFLVLLILAGCDIFPSASTAPVEIVFDTPRATIEGGVRLAPVESQWDGYGEAIDVRGEVLAIGASEWNQCGSGSVHLYRLVEGAWQKEAQLVASDRDDFKIQARQFEAMRFGTSVALGDGIIAIGAPGNVPAEEGGLPGAVYLYEYDGQNWAETAKLTPGGNVERTPSRLTPSVCARFRPSSFGALTALTGNTLAVGGDASGMVYVYQRGKNGWTEQARVQIPDVEGKTLYLASMSLFGDTLALSVYYISPQAEQQNSLPILSGNVIVYLFERAGDAWEESFQFSSEEESELLFFREVNVGASVTLEGESGQANLLAIGLPGFPNWTGESNPFLYGMSPDQVSPDQLPEFPASNRQTGVVYLFERSGGDWRGQATLKPAGWETPPGPGSFPAFPTHLEEGQESSDETGTGLLESVDLSDFIFPGDLYSANPEITFFGATVDLDGSQLAVTAGFANATYIFEHQDVEWVYRFSIKPVDEKVELWEDFAQVVKISGKTLLLGTPGEFGNSAYVFDIRR